MNILHIAALRNDPFTGVCVAAPGHIRHQGKIAEVALLNINNCTINGIEIQFIYKGKNWKDDVSPSFRNPDIVVFHEVYHIEFARIARSLCQDKIPYVIIPHGCLVKSAQQKKRWKKTIANALLFNGFINHCSSLQCLSDNELINTCFKVKKFVGTNGVAIPNKQKTDFNKEKIKIVYIGRLEIIPKGLDLLIMAIKRINENSDILKQTQSIDLYGPDIKGRYAEVEALIKQNGLDDIITLHHEINGEEKKKCLLETDIFVQTSRHEGMPMGILEAMSYGVPCIITEGTSLGTITREYDAGWVAETNVESIASFIIQAINEKALLELKSTQAKKLVEEKFSWDTIVRATVEKYKTFIRIDK